MSLTCSLFLEETSITADREASPLIIIAVWAVMDGQLKLEADFDQNT